MLRDELQDPVVDVEVDGEIFRNGEKPTSPFNEDSHKSFSRRSDGR